MILALLTSLALGGNLVVDAKVPTEVYVNNQPVAKLFYPSQLQVKVEPGPIELTLYIAGKPQRMMVEIPEEGSHRVVVGRTGITTDDVAQVEPADTSSVQFRITGDEGLQLRLDQGRHLLRSGSKLEMELDRGEHDFSVRSLDGTIIYANGTLMIEGLGDVVINLADGRLPEISGEGAIFHVK